MRNFKFCPIDSFNFIQKQPFDVDVAPISYEQPKKLLPNSHI